MNNATLLPAALVTFSLLAACAPGTDGQSTSGSPLCGDDAYEPNDTAVGAKATTNDTTLSWEDLDLVLCPGDDDWFAWRAPSLYGGSFLAQWDPDHGEIEIQALAAQQNDLGFPGGNPEGGSASAWVSSPEETSSNGFVRLRRADDGDEPMSYSLSIDLDICCND
ncbi:MAG: hypothetical protein GY898_08350 [Proteobacteria bacterium]|nr:hypothetical protein [Pseudomonadota bacterium]